MIDWQIYLERLPQFGHPGYRMYVMKSEDVSSAQFSVMINATFKTGEASCTVAPEDAFLDDSVGYKPDVRNFLQAMSDAAWEIGIKPKQVEGHTDELKAVRYHLEDMRTLVLKK